jgi:ammonium transporter Rh
MRLDEFMRKNVKIHDTCGIQFAHGIPGMLGAVTTAVCAGVAVYNF